MSTRHASADAPLRQNRYASDPEYVAMRGIEGDAVSKKAAYLSDPAQRALLFFIQSLSIEQQGTKRLVKDLVEMFAERIGTPSMFVLGMKPGQIYNARQVRIVREEIEQGGWDTEAERLERLAHDALAGIDADKPQSYKGRFPLKGEFEIKRTPVLNRWDDLLEGGARTDEAARKDAAENQCRQAEAVKHPESYPASVFIEHCRAHVLARLPAFLVELCINPRMELRADDDADTAGGAARAAVIDDNPDIARADFHSAKLRYFPRVLECLFEFKRRYEEQARQAFAMTTIGTKVFEALDYARKSRRMVLVQGHSGVGKTESVRAWWTCNRGCSLYVQLTGVNKARAFFGAIAKAAGLPCTASLSPEKMQFRVERFLESSRLILIIDEGQYLWPQGVRVTSHPEQVNWINTACANKGVPVAIVATEEFTAQRRRVEQQSTWESFQLRRRIRRVFALPAVPTKDDLALVARKVLPYGTEAMVNYIVGYALTCSGYMQAVVDTIDDARLLAEDAGRQRITVSDLKRAISEIRVPSDAAQKRVFAPAEKRGRKPRFNAVAELEPHDSSADTADMQPDGGDAAAASSQPRGSSAADEFLSDESAPKNRLRGEEMVKA